MKFHKVLFLMTAYSFCVCDNTESVKVKIKYGELLGTVERTFLKEQSYFSFRGIPYAEPPIGKLRFKPPVPHQGWKNVYEAYVTKPTCVQHSTRSRVYEPFGTSGSEDCLYISIFTSSLEGSTPVVVFDYNDNFRTGFNGTDTYSPDFFIEEDVTVVFISHRLGLLGYLTTTDDIMPANNGIKDFILGLQWIKENIAAFGGDPERVTIMGCRGGAVLADILLHSEKAKGLFSGVILQSGTALEGTFFEKKSKEALFRISDLLNITTVDSITLLEEFQNINAHALSSKDGHVYDVDNMVDTQTSIFPFGPIIENNNGNSIITSFPENSQVINDVPIMIGMNSREGLDLIAHYLFEPKLVNGPDNDFFFLFPIRSNFKFDPKSTIYQEAIKEIINFYLKDGILFDGSLLDYAVYMGDILQNYALNHAAKSLSSKAVSPVYYYMFDFRGSLNENMIHLARLTNCPLKTWGATIIDELCYLHFCSRIKENYKELFKLVSEQHELKVLRRMVRLWSNFAKTRNPTPEEEDDVLKNFKWKPIEKGSDKANYLHITKTLKMKMDPLEEREKFWDDFLAKYSQLAVDGVVKDQGGHDEL